MTSFFSPVVSGSIRSFSSSSPAIAAAVPQVIADAAPAEIMAAGTPISRAMWSPARSWSSGRGTKLRDAATMASVTSGGMREPPRTVTVPMPLITGSIPSRR